MKKLGWFLGFLLFFFCFFLNYYSGLFLWRIQQRYPAVRNFSDAADLLFGRREALVTHIAISITLFLTMSNYLLVLALSIKDIFYQSSLCQTATTFIAVAILLIPSQQRTLHCLSFTSAFSVLSIVVVLIICIVTIFTASGIEKGDTVVFPDSSVTFLGTFNALSSFVFASGGQLIYLEMIGEMKEPNEFPKALVVGLALMFLIYASIMTVSYSAMGDKVPDFLVLVISPSVTSQITNCLLAFHVTVSYTLYQQVLVRQVHTMYAHHVARHSSIVNHTTKDSTHFVRSSVQWLVLSSFFLLCACMIANLVPFFSDLVSLIGSLVLSLISYVYPALFFYRSSKLMTFEIAPFEKFVTVLLITFGLLLFFVGTYSNVDSIISKWQDNKQPFSC
eukprot:c20922_g2_i1.p1 GENE.c20922_g2_i1~~c20922_g2_i1.p1  ORF type:complete len:391 (+),score=111.99 c20922_g2_i1:238-1410(+)